MSNVNSESVSVQPSPELVAQCLSAIMLNSEIAAWVYDAARRSGRGGPEKLWVETAREYAQEILRQSVNAKSESPARSAEPFARVWSQSIPGGIAVSNAAILSQAELYSALGAAVEKIEAAGASVALTEASTLVCEIRSAVGNQWNPANRFSAENVRLAAKRYDAEMEKRIKEREEQYARQIDTK